jgi:dienelactone hydrolase/fibronectin type 3 domain-containing protein
MKRLVLFSSLILFVTSLAVAQNVFDPNDGTTRYDSTTTFGSPTNPNPAIAGLQKWVSVPTNSISTGFGSWDASSYKAYYINVSGRRLAFRLKFPKSYTNPDSVNKRYPVMLFFHGAGEPGCPSNGGIYNNEKQLLHGGQLFASRVDNNQFDGYLLYPQVLTTNCSSTWPSTNDLPVLAILDSMIKYVRADIDRLFIDGLSDGGRNTWRFARAYPQRVAMVAPSSMYAGTTSHGAMIHIPVWFATGGLDSNPSPAQAQQTLTTFQNLGGDIRYTMYPELGHSVWNQHWAEPDFVPYMNSMHKANPLVFFQHNDWCAGQTIAARLGLTAGFSQYEWMKDNVVIARRANGVNTILVAAAVTSFTGNEIVVKQYGTYRARFRRTATGAWSEWSPKSVVVGIKSITNPLPITVNGLRSSVLPALDGSTTVPLTLAPGFTNYRWYTSTGTTVLSNVQTYNPGVGVYRGRYDERFGCGSNYSPNFTVVNANGNPKPDPAAQLTGLPVTQTITALTWVNNPSPTVNETAFELYRGTVSGGPYQLVKILPAETTTYNDSNLTAGTSYYYVVRAINNTGASAASNEATVKTLVDNKPPSAPLNFAYGGSTPTSVSLRWSPSTDNIGIKRYDIYIGGVKHYSTTSTNFTANNLDPNKWYAFTVRAVDPSGNLSAPTPQIMGYTHQQGLNYKYYEGTFNNLPDFDLLTPVKTGTTSAVDAGNSFRNNADNYAIMWEGYIYVPTTAFYQIATISDEGSKVYIDIPVYNVNAPAVANNDGIHPPQLPDPQNLTPISLAKGYHRIIVTYFERSGTEAMALAWGNNAGITGELIPPGFLTPTQISGNPPVITPSGLSATAQSFNKIKLTWNDLSDDETGFEIVRSTSPAGVYIPAGRVGPGKTTYTDSALNSATTYYYKVRATGPLSESPYTDPAFETTLPAPGTPIAPSALESESSTTTKISLGWIDNANNETEIQVWRSADEQVTFTQIGTLQPNSNSFTDNSITPFAKYYYYVVGANANGNGASSDTIGVIAGNNAPVMSVINNMFVKTGATLSQDFTVADAGDVVTISIDNKPSFITLQHLSGNNYRITLNPTTDNIGWHNLQMKATDSKKAVVTRNFVVSVADKNTRSVYLKFGPAGKLAPAPFTNWLGTRAANNVISNLRDENNVVTPYSVTTLNAWTGTSNLGHLSGNNSGVIPDSALQGGLIDNGVAKQIMIGGLNPALRYNLVFVGSQNEGLNAQTRLSAGALSDTFNARYNTNVTGNLNNVVPNASGQVTVTLTRIGGSLVTYLNALIIEEYQPSITVLNPLNLYAEALDRTRINLTWSDRASNESAANGYELTRATDSLFTQNVVTVNLVANTTAYQATGLTPNTGYWFRVRARSGATLSEVSNRAKAFTPSSTVLVNFNANVTNAPFPWNNTIAQPTSPITFTNLQNQAGNNSGLNLRIEQIFNGEFNAGMSTGNNSGIVPDVALQANYWQDKTQISQMRLSGLNQTRKYRIGFFGSSGPNGWVKGNYTGKYSINGRSVYLNAWSNTTKIAYIDGVLPDENGEILLTFSTTPEAQYGFHGGVTVDDYSDGSISQVVLPDNQVLDAIPNDENAYGLKNRMYPNPFGDDITVDYNNVTGVQKVTAFIYDVTGRLVYKQDYSNLVSGFNQLRLKTGSLKAGSKSFMIVLSSSNGKILMTNKMIKK